MQKTPKPFRLSEKAIQIIEAGARDLNTTQTAIVELALLEFESNRAHAIADEEYEARNSLSLEAKQAKKQEKRDRKAWRFATGRAVFHPPASQTKETK